MPHGGLAVSEFRGITAITADYRCTEQDHGKIFTNRGASGAVVLYLPPTADIPVGWSVRAFVVADQTLTVTAATADTMVLFNDAAADSLAFSTASEKIGNGIECIWDGTGWLGFVFLGIETATPVVAT